VDGALDQARLPASDIEIRQREEDHDGTRRETLGSNNGSAVILGVLIAIALRMYGY
jgi:hypothetical protein